MAMSEDAPDIVVGIDFGMTCTGVAWSRGPTWAEPKAFQHWPGKMISELANKVPTALKYSPASNHVEGWGFLCDQNNDRSDVVDCFKLHLDPAFRDDPRPDRPTTQQARRWFHDYLRCLHDHIAEVMTDIAPNWRIQKVEFTFSVPTTWKSPSMIADMEQIIKGAGFGADGRDHRARIGLTEAEAAAVYASKQRYQKGDVILVCDAGGGTTDVNILRITSNANEPLALEPLTWVEGRPVGSIAIDNEFYGMILKRLNHIKHNLRDNPRDVADRMMHEDGLYERFKCSFGTALSKTMPALYLQVPGSPQGLDCTEAGIENSSMVFTRDDLKAIFDVQLNKILMLIDEQLDRVSKANPSVRVSYLVLAGGLGSSPYLRDRLRSHYATGPGSIQPATENMMIVGVEEPQLAVTQGLVIDRVQSISLGTETFTKRCSRQSYGIICREEYKAGLPRHLGQTVTTDKFDGKTWVDGQIQWFVEQGQMVSVSGVSRPYLVKMAPGKEFEPWETEIVVSTVSRDQLPTNIQQDTARRLCKVSSVLNSQQVDMKLKNRHWYNRGKKYWRFRFDVKALIGAADLRFQLLTKDAQVINTDHNTIEVVWQVVRDPAEHGPVEIGPTVSADA